jgi:aspartate beta-hydroxylase
VLILDVWNPHLTVEEHDMIRHYYQAADASGLNPERT